MIPFCGYQKNFGDRICNTGINKEQKNINGIVKKNYNIFLLGYLMFC